MTEGNGKVADKDAFAQFNKRRFAYVHDYEPGIEDYEIAPVRIRNLSETEKSRYEVDTLPIDANKNWRDAAMLKQRRLLIVKCVVDHEGNPVFSVSDVAQMAEWDGRLVAIIFSACQQHCGLSNIEATAKNSEQAAADNLRTV